MARIDIYDSERWRELAGQSHYSVNRLAHMLGLSPRHLERITRKVLRCSPKTWLDSCQMKRAAAMVLEGRAVKVVAEELGFKQVSHFSLKFKRFHGTAPTIYQIGNRPTNDTDQIQLQSVNSRCAPPQC